MMPNKRFTLAHALYGAIIGVELLLAATVVTTVLIYWGVTFYEAAN